MSAELLPKGVLHRTGQHVYRRTTVAGLTDFRLQQNILAFSGRVEAAAVGTPVAAHAVGGMTRVIEECRAGLAVTEHTPEGYARAVRELTKRSRPAGYIASRYDADHNAREIAGVYRAALAAAG